MNCRFDLMIRKFVHQACLPAIMSGSIVNTENSGRSTLNVTPASSGFLVTAEQIVYERRSGAVLCLIDQGK